MAKSKVRMKLLIDTTKMKRVLFAEASKDCVDFLFHILSLPIATIIRLLEAQQMVGSLPILYKSLQNLSDAYIQSSKGKDVFLKPAAPVSSSWSVPLLALNDAPVGGKFYWCGHNCDRNGHISDDPLAVCPCGKKMKSNVTYVAPPAKKVAAEDGGLVKGVVTYMVMDDLAVMPMSTISTIALLNKFNVKDVGALEEKIVDFGMNEAIKLLKASLESKNVLTQVFC